MRRTFALLLAALLTLGGAGTVLGAQVVLRDREDMVTIEEEVLYGDTEAAQGLRVTLKTRCGQSLTQLLWDTSFAAGGDGTADTAFSYLRRPEPDWYQPPSNTITIDFCAANETFRTNAEDDEDWWQRMENAGFLSLPARDAAGRTAAGEERTETVDLWDYYQLYSLCATADLDMGGETFYRSGLPGTELLTEFFRFPVLPGTTAEVTVRRSQSGPVEETRTSCGIDFPQILSGTADENAAYLFFDRADIDPSLNTSQIAGGYGVYRLDYHRETVITEPEEGLIHMDDTLVIDGISTVLPVEGTVKEVLGSEDGETLLVLSEEDGTLRLSVLERGSDRLLQQIDLLPMAEGDDLYRAELLGEDLLVRLPSGALAVAAHTASGYEAVFTADVTDAALAPFFSDGAKREQYRWLDSAAAFDGERLALLYPLDDADTALLPELGLLLLDADGTPVFAARYRHNVSDDRGAWPRMTYDDPDNSSPEQLPIQLSFS